MLQSNVTFKKFFLTKFMNYSIRNKDELSLYMIINTRHLNFNSLSNNHISNIKNAVSV